MTSPERARLQLDGMAGPEPSDGRAFSRRDFLTLGAGAFVVLSLPRAFHGQRREVVRRTVPVMGTFAEFAIIGHDPRLAQAAIDAAIGELQLVERQLTRFRPDSDVGRSNLAPVGSGIRIGATTVNVLREALRWSELTGGRFDPCLARTMLLWDVGSRRKPPDAAAVRRFAGQKLYRYLELEPQDDSWLLRLHHPEAGIDLGAIGKGYGVDRAVRVLRSRGVRNALVNVGGDLYAMGLSAEGDPWKIGVRSPNDPTRLATTLRAQDLAVATSGDYVQFFEHRGRRYHHLLDPKTGEPRRSAWRSVTVTAATCTAADAAATAVFGSEPASVERRLARWEPTARLVHLA